MPLLGLISDTHGLLRPEALDTLRGVDRILHAGDIGGPAIVDQLSEIAPVVVVRGNNDRDPWGRALPESSWIDYEGLQVLLIHDAEALDFDPGAAGLDLVVSGHSHRPSDRVSNGVRWLNPGSAGPRRFDLPVTVARLDTSTTPPLFEVSHLLTARGLR